MRSISRSGGMKSQTSSKRQKSTEFKIGRVHVYLRGKGARSGTFGITSEESDDNNV